jgi:uncharacterized protein (DUF1778 family)
VASAWGSAWGSAWSNSWGSVGAVVVTPPAEEERAPGGGFSRREYRDLLDARRKVREAAQDEERKRAQQALERAAEAAQQVIEAQRDHERAEIALEESRTARLVDLLEMAAGAEKSATIIKRANQATALALQMLKRYEDEQEDAAIASLLLM